MRKLFLPFWVSIILAACGTSDRNVLADSCASSEDPAMCVCMVDAFETGLEAKFFSKFADDVRSSEDSINFFDVLQKYENEISDKEFSKIMEAIEPCYQSLDDRFDEISKEIRTKTQ